MQCKLFKAVIIHHDLQDRKFQMATHYVITQTNYGNHAWKIPTKHKQNFCSVH